MDKIIKDEKLLLAFFKRKNKFKFDAIEFEAINNTYIQFHAFDINKNKIIRFKHVLDYTIDDIYYFKKQLEYNKLQKLLPKKTEVIEAKKIKI